MRELYFDYKECSSVHYFLSYLINVGYIKALVSHMRRMVWHMRNQPLNMSGLYIYVQGVHKLLINEIQGAIAKQ